MTGKSEMEIKISTETFKRLEVLARGFDTPEEVIKRLLDEMGTKSEKIEKPKIIFADDELNFKKDLLKTQIAEIILYKSNDEREVIHWSAKSFSEKSNLRANLWSGKLREWKTKNIIRAELAILPKDGIDIRTDINKAIALDIGLKYEEMKKISDKYEVSSDGSKTIRFNDDCSEEILSKIAELRSDNSVKLKTNIFNKLAKLAKR